MFLSVEDIARRYRVSRTRAYRLIKEPWFPAPVVGGAYRWSLASVRAAEAAKANGTAPQPGRTPPKPQGGVRR